jgi:5-methylcytosine-specific restriction endonuclease McrA
MPKKYSVDAPPGFKACRRCETTKPVSEFSPNRVIKDGYSTYCRPCAVDRQREWANANREHHLAQRAARHVTNREAEQARKKAWRQANPDKVRAAKRRWARENPARIQAGYHGYRARNLDQIKARERDRSAQRRAADPNYCADAVRRWSKMNNAKVREYVYRRRAIIAGATVGPVSYAAILARDGLVCGICGGAVERAELSFDHVIPLSKQGPRTESNIQVAHKVCNSRKGAKWPSTHLS